MGEGLLWIVVVLESGFVSDEKLTFGGGDGEELNLVFVVGVRGTLDFSDGSDCISDFSGTTGEDNIPGIAGAEGSCLPAYPVSPGEPGQTLIGDTCLTDTGEDGGVWR